MTAREHGRLIDLEMALLNSIRAEIATDFNPLIPEDRAHLNEALKMVWEIEERLREETEQTKAAPAGG